MDFKIVDVFTQDGQLVVKAEHYHVGGALWFVENYTWQGREGLKQKRATNALGQLLLDDGTVAPTSPSPVVGSPPIPVLPPGRAWALRPGPHMVNDSILGVIRSIHQRRLLTGWPQGGVDQLSIGPGTTQDLSGSPTLLARFQGLLGRAE